MRYIGPFFRMNSLSEKEISGQLFHLSKESIKTLVLSSKCGLLAQIRTSKKSSIDDISILNNFSPLLCLYKKSSPLFIHNKSSHSFDESTFKKEINPSTCALMTLCLLELSEYYSHYDEEDRHVISLEKPFKYIAKEQLQFYSENLRNDEGLFVDKKNISDGNSKGFNLIDKDTNFTFSDQAFMMDAYLLYSHYNASDKSSDEFSNFSYEILEMFKNYKPSLYDLSLSENIKIFLALNIFYKYSSNSDAKALILDLGDFLIAKYKEKDNYLDSIDDCSLLSICLMEAYKHTEIIAFKEVAKEITEKLISLYNSDKNIFIKVSDKKESKYSCLEVNSYLLELIIYSIQEDKSTELKPIISGIYRKFFINGGLLSSWPEAPTLDEVERYKKLSLHSNDMLDEIYFRMPTLPTPKSIGAASIFLKNLTYSKKKDSFSTSRTSFDSNKNMFNFFLIIYYLKDTVEDIMEFTKSANPLNLHIVSEINNKSNKSSTNTNLYLNNNEDINVDSYNTSISKTLQSNNNINLINSEKLDINDINNSKKFNNSNLSNKKHVSNSNSSFKHKKYKKNKSNNYHNSKKI